MLLTQKKFISEKTFLQVSKMLTLIISYSNIVYLVSNFPSFLDLLCYRGNSVFFTFLTIPSWKPATNICQTFEGKGICAGILLFADICIAVGDPVIKRQGCRFHYLP
jgi:hypothetical protein